MNILQRAAPIFLAALVLVSPAQAHNKKNQVKAAQVFLEAADRTDLRTPGSPPFELLADIKLDIQGSWLNGNYLLLWESPDQWREEVVLPGYQRIKVKTADGIWLHRSLNYEIPSVADLDTALDFAAHLRKTAAVSKVGKLKATRVSGSGLECSHVTVDVDLADENLCFDIQQSLLKAETFPNGASLAPNLTSVEYADFAPFGTRLYPRTIRLFSQKDAFLAFSVKRIALLVAPPADEFAPPKDAIFEATCVAPVKPRLINRVLPEYPRDERVAGHSAHVVLYVLIEPDGSVHNATVVFPVAPDFDAAALAAVRQWRYRPRSCNGKPTPFETYITVYFQMR